MLASQTPALKSLESKHYHKLIIGAALKDFASIEHYAYLFALAGADAIDISAFPLSLISAQRGIAKALEENPNLTAPLIMVSVNIGEDPHFRRIVVNETNCTECLLCIPSCPANAFSASENKFAYEPNLCYGCSNCLPYCSYDALSFDKWEGSLPSTITELTILGANAFEIHLSPDLKAFKDFYAGLPRQDSVLESFSIGSQLLSEEQLLEAATTIIHSVRAKYAGVHPLILQVDGLPLSGARDLYSLEESGYKLDSENDKDLACINAARIVIEHLGTLGLREAVYIQIAGGTTEHSLAKAKSLGADIDGVAIGSYARKLISDSKQDPKAIARKLISKHHQNVQIL